MNADDKLKVLKESDMSGLNRCNTIGNMSVITALVFYTRPIRVYDNEDGEDLALDGGGLNFDDIKLEEQ